LSCELSWPGVRLNSAHVAASASQPSRILTRKACHSPPRWGGG